MIEDDAAQVELLTYNLGAAGYDVCSAASAEAGELLLIEKSFDLIILDWNLPGMAGIELCEKLRHADGFVPLPILMVTARGEEGDRVLGLAAGADDYVVKPYSVPELLARVGALLRRTAPEGEVQALKAGDIRLDRVAHRVMRGSREVRLGPTEYRLLEVLLTNAGRVLSRSQLIDHVWGSTAEIDERTIDVHIGRLRRSLVRGMQPDPIRTVRGAGYVLGQG